MDKISRIDDIFKTVYKDDLTINYSNLDINYEGGNGYLRSDLNFEKYNGLTRSPTQCLNASDITHCVSQVCMISGLFMIEQEFNIEFNENVGDHVLMLSNSARYRKPVFRSDKNFISVSFKRKRKISNKFKTQLYVDFHGIISDAVDFNLNAALVDKNIHR